MSYGIFYNFFLAAQLLQVLILQAVALPEDPVPVALYLLVRIRHAQAFGGVQAELPVHFDAVTAAVPEPRKGSKTIAPGRDEARISLA